MRDFRRTFRGTATCLVLVGVVQTIMCVPALAGGLALPPEAQQGLDTLYGGDPDSAIQIFRGIEKAQPEHPLGYLLEVEARWWKGYCEACEVKYGIIDVFHRGKRPQDGEYLALADKAIRLAAAQLAESDSSEMHLYSGLGWALKARLYVLRDERRAAAHAGVYAREEFLKTLRLNPEMADAETGLGLYNYYVDTLSAFVKILRFFMGIPGGSRKEGTRQLEIGMNRGELTAVEARFYLARNLRNYEEQYDRAASVLQSLTVRYPLNPIFLLMLGNLNAELNRHEKAAASFRAAAALSSSDAVCAARVQQIARAFLDSMP